MTNELKRHINSNTILHKQHICTFIINPILKIIVKLNREEYIDLNVKYLLLISDPNTIKLSSSRATISVVSPPLRSSSPRFLKAENEKSCAFHSKTTCFSLASMSFSFTADIQMSYR